MKRTITVVLLILATLTLAACGTTGSFLLTGASIARRVIGSASEKEVLCKYYSEHKTEIEVVRAYYKANWQSVPEKDKPVLLALNEQLNACEATTPAADAPVKKTTAQKLLAAFKRAVEIYHELKVAGVLKAAGL